LVEVVEIAVSAAAAATAAAANIVVDVCSLKRSFLLFLLLAVFKLRMFGLF
jgi:hypothetical protein